MVLGGFRQNSPMESDCDKMVPIINPKSYLHNYYTELYNMALYMITAIQCHCIAQSA